MLGINNHNMYFLGLLFILNTSSGRYAPINESSPGQSAIKMGICVATMCTDYHYIILFPCAGFSSSQRPGSGVGQRTPSLNSRTQQALIETPLFASTVSVKKKKNYYFDFFVASRMYLSEEHIDKTMELTGFISYVTRTSLIYFLTMPRNGSSFYENDYHKKDVGWSRGRLYDTRDHHYVLAVRTFISLSFT